MLVSALLVVFHYSTSVFADYTCSGAVDERCISTNQRLAAQKCVRQIGAFTLDFGDEEGDAEVRRRAKWHYRNEPIITPKASSTSLFVCTWRNELNMLHDS